MSKKDDFKNFIKDKTYLVKYVKSNEKTWQDFYELYDLYGDDERVWNEYNSVSSSSSINKISDLLKNADIDKVKEHINNAQKALSFIDELTTKESVNDISPIVERPLNKFFED